VTAPSPSPRSLQQAALAAGPSATVVSVRSLPGGSHARTWLVCTADPPVDLVLRDFPPGDPAAADEERVLRALDGLGGLAPRLVDADPGGASWSDRPAVLISRLPGSAEITPADPVAWAAQLGRTLALVHAAPSSVTGELPRVLDRPRSSVAALAGPAAMTVAADWAAIRAADPALSHGDFWSGNTVWEAGRLTGVVDWSGAAVGPRGFDVGWCRLDLYLLYDESVADVFLTAYREASGTPVPDPLRWDLWSLARSHDIVGTWDGNYRDLGRPDLTAPVLQRAHAAWTAQLLAREWTPTHTAGVTPSRSAD
jgi:aminoglycoside phosphotransferase (APT) family kinase protein